MNLIIIICDKETTVNIEISCGLSLRALDRKFQFQRVCLRVVCDGNWRASQWEEINLFILIFAQNIYEWIHLEMV